MNKWKLLRITYPERYKELMEVLAEHNIHPYDITASSRFVDDNVEIKVSFGQDFAQNKTKLFTENDLKGNNPDFANFCHEVGEACKEVLIADYFKMVKP